MATSTSTPERLLQRLDWQVIRRLDGLLQGDYRTLFRGNGVDFADLREYQYGDDIRYIDWSVTARMDTPYVREYLEDREITAWFLLDLSPSVDFGTGETERLKRSVLIDFVTTLARLLTRHGNRVGAVFYGTPRGAHDPGPRWADPGPAPHQRPAPASRASRPRPFTDLTPLARGRSARDQGPLARVRHLRLHQRPGLGALAEPAVAAPRGPGRPAVRPARGRAARRRPADHGGRRDRRAALRRHPRQGVPGAVPGGRGAARDDPSRRRSSDPASTSCRCRPTTTWSRRSSGWRPSDSDGGAESMSFIWPPMLLLALAIPARRRSSTSPWSAVADGVSRPTGLLATAGERPAAPRDGRASAPAPGCPHARRSGRPRRRDGAAAGRHQRPAGGGHGHPRLRRVGQHGRRPTWRRPGWRRPRRPPARSSSGSRRPCGSGSSRSATAACPSRSRPTTRPRSSAAIDRLAPGARHVDRGRHPVLARGDRRGRRGSGGRLLHATARPAPTVAPTPVPAGSHADRRSSSC